VRERSAAKAGSALCADRKKSFQLKHIRLEAEVLRT
jgi:hypothetical protein